MLTPEEIEAIKVTASILSDGAHHFHCMEKHGVAAKIFLHLRTGTIGDAKSTNEIAQDSDEVMCTGCYGLWRRRRIRSEVGPGWIRVERLKK